VQPLPVDAVLKDLAASLRRHPCAVLRAPPGSGKTTRVAPALLDAGLAPQGITVLEPRRVAARAAARRVSFERGTPLGEETGYQVKFDHKVGPKTRVRFVTDGVLLRMLLHDACLEGASIVIFDEFHERRLNADLALGMVRRVQQTVRPDLKIVVMSATLDAQAVGRWLGSCPVIESDGGLFPVNVTYDERSSGGSAFNHEFYERHLPRAARSAACATRGGLLAFLPGVGEIRRAQQALVNVAREFDLYVMPLYGDLPPQQQDEVLAPSTRRKLVLATNVAETSITIPDIEAVIDCGYHRQLTYDDALGLDRLELTRISKASAEQRAGRAGRTGPGLCVRMWGMREERGLEPFQIPEVRRLDLAGALLALRAWGERDPLAFPWFEAPRPEAVERGLTLLERLGAVDKGRLTEVGKAMAAFPAHPRIARMLLEGYRRGVPDQVAMLAAALSESDASIWSSAALQRAPGMQCESDAIALLDECERRVRLDHAQVAAAGGPVHQLAAARRQFRQILDAVGGSAAGQPPAGAAAASPDEALLRTIMAGYLDRLARRRETSPQRAVMTGGKGVRLTPWSAVRRSELFVCIEVDARLRDGDMTVHMASAVQRDWLDQQRIATRVEARFDARSERVQAVRRVCYDDLVLEEGQASHVSDEEMARVLEQAAAAAIDRVKPGDRAFLQYAARVNCLRDWMPELQLPLLDDRLLISLLPELCPGRRSFEELRKAPWLDAVKQRLSFAQRQAVEREAPERLPVPSGNKLTVEYAAGKRPVLAVKIQELFGLAETPRIAGGRVPLLLHLLAPNGRPQQVTDDLRSFWNSAYQQVRKELRGRYPKHAWPEDPWSASPQKRPKRA
jgi:ATP-dependent helicase HrpB